MHAEKIKEISRSIKEGAAPKTGSKVTKPLPPTGGKKKGYDVMGPRSSKQLRHG